MRSGRYFVRICFACLWWGFGLCLQGDDTEIRMREVGMIYLDGVDEKDRPAVILNVPMPVYMTRDLRSVLMMLPAETRVEVIAVEEGYLGKICEDQDNHKDRGHGLYLVRAQTASRRVEGWMRGEDMPRIKPELVQAALLAEKRRIEVSEAIMEKRVLEGMTMEEVRKSLGKPDRVSFRREAVNNPKRIDVWSYLIYERVLKTRTVLNPWGMPVIESYYEKEVVGERTIEFLNGVVVAMEERRDLKR